MRREALELFRICQKSYLLIFFTFRFIVDDLPIYQQKISARIFVRNFLHHFVGGKILCWILERTARRRIHHFCWIKYRTGSFDSVYACRFCYLVHFKKPNDYRSGKWKTGVIGANCCKLQRVQIGLKVFTLHLSQESFHHFCDTSYRQLALQIPGSNRLFQMLRKQFGLL